MTNKNIYARNSYAFLKREAELLLERGISTDDVEFILLRYCKTIDDCRRKCRTSGYHKLEKVNENMLESLEVLMRVLRKGEKNG